MTTSPTTSRSPNSPAPPKSPACPNSTAEIRKAFLKFFRARDHRVVPSHSLLPPADPTLLFVNAGMVQFKDFFTGDRPPPYGAATSTQKCLRVSGKHNDLENVGRTRRHQTLFEMLGNFSFGDYFKEGAIRHAWDFLTGVLDLDPGRMVVTYFEGNDAVACDDEARELWLEISGLPADRVVPMTEKDNFWAMGETGPCGPCSEIYFDLRPDEPWNFPADEARYMEVWNLVFMQYDRAASGELRPLPIGCVDTGMGLERVTSVVQQVGSNFETDAMMGLIELVQELSGKQYGGRFGPDGVVTDDPGIELDVAFRVVADHARATAFLIAEAVYPDNEGRGYVLRRIMRRAIRFGRNLGLVEPFLWRVCDRVVDIMGDVFPELVTHREIMVRVVRREEERFGRTLESGLKLIDKALVELQADGGDTLDGDIAFSLYDSNGFPPDLTALIARERGFSVDMDGFRSAMKRQRARGRKSWKKTMTVAEGAAGEVQKLGLFSAFTGYDEDVTKDATVLAIFKDDVSTPFAHPGDLVDVVLDRTPFYGEGGGQVGDQGCFAWNDRATIADRAVVIDTQKPATDVILHRVRIERGSLDIGDKVDAWVDLEHRAGVKAHHSATHILHKALRDVLGGHVQQRGSLVEPNRLRFDFSHFAALTDDEVSEIERRANQMVLGNIEVDWENTSMDEAKERGALMFFGDKYGEQVRVLAIGGSVELCGGTHVGRSGDIGIIKITAETGISAGVRRLEGQCHLAAVDRLHDTWRQLHCVAQRFNVKAEQADGRVVATLEHVRRLEKELQQVKQQLALAKVSGGPGEDDSAIREKVGELNVTAMVVDGVGGKDLRVLGDQERDKNGPGALLLASRCEGGRVALLVAVSQDVSDRLHAGKLVGKLAPLVGGKGGGRPDFAQAGGDNPAGIDAAVQAFFAHARQGLS